MPPVLQQINKATGYTPNLGAPSGGRVYAPASAPAPTGGPATVAYQDPSSGGGGGGTGGGGGSAPAVNPYTTAFLAALPGQLSSIQQGEAASGTAAHAGLVGSIGDLVAQLTNDQDTINQNRKQAELGRIQGSAGVLSMIQHGLQSGGVQLANKNASNSSAAGALARAYSDIGRRAQTQVGQQYAQAENAQDVSQNHFNTNKSAKVNDIQTQKTQSINSIVADAQNKLAYLAAQAASASVPDKVDIQAQMQTVRDQATSQLADIDSLLSTGVGAINPADQATLRGQAAELNAKGTAAATPFTYSTTAPAQFQNTGPAAAQLPIFTVPSKKQGS